MSEGKKSILKIIESVRKRPCIWDVNSGDYNKRYKSEKAWTEVSEEVGCSASFCKDKWKNVRNGFLRTTVKDVPSNKMTLFKPFYLYDEMKFLLPCHLDLKKNEQNCILMEIKCEDNEISENVVPSGEDNETVSIDDKIIPLLEKEMPLDEEKEMSSNEENDIALSDAETLSFHGPNITLLATEMSPSFNQSKSDINMASTFSSSEISNARNKSGDDIDRILTHLTNRRKKSPEESVWRSFLKGLMPEILSLSSEKQRFLKKKFVEIVYDMHATE